MSEIVHIINLSEPVILGSEKIEQLKFKKAKAKQIRGLKLAEMDVGALLDIGGKLCGQTPLAMDELSPADALEVCAYVGKLLGGGPAIPTEQSA